MWNKISNSCEFFIDAEEAEEEARLVAARRWFRDGVASVLCDSIRNL